MSTIQETIVSDCTNCNYIYRERDGKKYCRRHPFPRMQWWGPDLPCSDASFIEKPDQDYSYDGRYDPRYRVKKPSSKNKI